MRHARAVQLAAFTLAAFLSFGCDPEVRTLKPAESERLSKSLAPLLIAAYGPDVTGCRLGAVAMETDVFFSAMINAADSRCDTGVLVSLGAMNDLTARALQALLAHDLGHLQSKHAVGSSRQAQIRGARTDTGHQAVLYASREQFTPDEEAEADRAAAKLLVVAWRGSNVGCLATADLYEDIAKDRSRWGRWLSRHPFPERRVGTVVQACDDATRPPR